jgi:predicted fused transcriptional regulator/phosphomethylpyrimidine kinase
VALPACLRLSEEVFPRVRAAAARRLVGQGWSQARAAQAVGLSQPMVSRHLAAPAEQDPLVLTMADELADEAANPRPHGAGASAWCATLAVGQERPGGEAALADLLAAERLLRERNPIAVVPQVGLNLARALPASAKPEEVLAFPGRLVEAGGRLVAPAPPAFGGSGHLARLLLHLRGRDAASASAPLALANVRGGKEAAAAAKKLGWTVATLSGEGDAESRFRRAAAKADAYHDPGAVGTEPCLYLPGADARAVAQKILQLATVIA